MHTEYYQRSTAVQCLGLKYTDLLPTDPPLNRLTPYTVNVHINLTHVVVESGLIATRLGKRNK